MNTTVGMNAAVQLDGAQAADIPDMVSEESTHNEGGAASVTTTGAEPVEPLSPISKKKAEKEARLAERKRKREEANAMKHPTIAKAEEWHATILTDLNSARSVVLKLKQNRHACTITTEITEICASLEKEFLAIDDGLKTGAGDPANLRKLEASAKIAHDLCTKLQPLFDTAEAFAKSLLRKR